MSPHQILSIYAKWDRAEGGYPKLPYVGPPQLSIYEMFVGQCRAKGVRDSEEIKARWAAEQVRMKTEEQRAKEYAKAARARHRKHTRRKGS